MISLFILLGFAIVNFEDTFFCSDETATTHSETDCCAECLTIHTMALTRETGIKNIVVDSRIIFSHLSSQPDPSASRIDQPPIA